MMKDLKYEIDQKALKGKGNKKQSKRGTNQKGLNKSAITKRKGA